MSSNDGFCVSVIADHEATHLSRHMLKVLDALLVWELLSGKEENIVRDEVWLGLCN